LSFFKTIKKSENYKLAVLTGYAYTILTLITSIFITRHIFKYFDNVEYGVFILVVESISIFEILDFGFSGGMMSFLSREVDDYVRINKLISTLFYAQVVTSILAALFAVSMILDPTILFKNISIEEGVLKNAIVIASFSLFITMLTKSISQILYARRKIAGDNYMKIITLFIRVGLIFLLLKKFPTIEFLIFVTLITQIINLFQTIYLVRKLEPEIHFQIKNMDFSTLNEVWKVSSWFALGGFALLFIERFDNIMTGTIVGVKAITILVITRKLFDIARTFIFQLNNNYRPYFGKMVGQGKHEEVLVKFRNLSILSVLAACFVGGGIVIANDFFIEKWVGLEKYGGSILSLLLFFNLVFHAWKISYRAFLSSNLIAKELSISSFIEGVLNLLFAYILGMKYGVKGIVASTFLSGIVVQGVALLYIIQKHKIESIRNFAMRNIGQIILVLLMGYGAFQITVHIDLLILRLILWFIVMSITLLVVHKFYLKEYSLGMVLKGKLL
jgi:O-antigen/teichoic acid export membrane protein